MKKRFIALTLLMIASVAVFAGCGGPQSKTFSKDGVSIVLNTDFKEETKAGHTMYLESNYASVSVKRERFDDLDGLTNESSLRDYTNSVVNNNELGTVTIQNNSGNSYNYDYFTYEKKVNNESYTYMATTVKGNDSFYLITFQTKKTDYSTYKTNFEEWAKSVKVDGAAD
jgi:hypothetical protein